MMSKKRRIKKFLLFLLILAGSVGLFNTYKPLPKGLSLEGRVWRVPESSIKFLSDITYIDDNGERRSEQHIFDEILKMINEARRFIVVDMFLYNSYLGKENAVYRKLSDDLTDALVKRKKENPQIKIFVISDPINNIYGAKESPHFTKLKETGIPVVITNLKKLRDPNSFYSPLWRIFFSWFGNGANGLAPNPFKQGGEKVTVRTYLSMMNFKANHRKLIAADKEAESGVKISSLITSANPHDASSFHSNIAIKIDDHIWKDVVAGESAVAKFSGFDGDALETGIKDIADSEGDVEVQFLTEGKIEKKLLDIINATKENEYLDIAMFYLSDRDIIKALIAAGKKGAKIRIILDPNKDAFGYKKIGIPNRQAAEDLIKSSGGKIKARWCDTSGEQCHSKIVLAKGENRREMLLGSANLTRRNLDNYNLEADVYLKSEIGWAAFGDAYAFFEKIWNNKDGRTYTADYGKYKENSFIKYLIYQVQERTGLSSF